jgi:hypothetical protein
MTSIIRSCSVPECDAVRVAYGFCNLHAGRFRRHGDPLIRGGHGGRRDSTIGPSENVPDPEPVKKLSRELRHEQLRQTDFRLAWPRCVEVALRGLEEDEAASWRTVLTETSGEWRSAYDRDGPPRSISALGLRVDDDTSTSVRRSAPPVISHGARADAEGTLGPADALPWCA